jgi:phosphate transport system protein
MAMKISNDLERVGDHAVNIAEMLQYLIEAPPFPVIPEIEEMQSIATHMLASALDAFIRADNQLARRVLLEDDRVDDLHDNNFRILLTHMMEDPRKITAGMDLLLISGNLERIADHLPIAVLEDVQRQLRPWKQDRAGEREDRHPQHQRLGHWALPFTSKGPLT